MKVPSLLISAASLFLSASPVHADIMYQCVDESGHKSFSNIKSSAKGSKCISMDLGGSAPAPATSAQPRTATPASFPKVDPNSQKARDGDRRRILETELAEEQKNLDQARKNLAEQQETVLPNERMQYKTGGGINGDKVEERIQPYRDKVALHERNIEALQKEMSNLR